MEMFGFTARCPGCMSLLKAMARRAHTENCRRRIESVMRGTVKAGSSTKAREGISGKSSEKGKGQTDAPTTTTTMTTMTTTRSSSSSSAAPVSSSSSSGSAARTGSPGEGNGSSRVDNKRKALEGTEREEGEVEDGGTQAEDSQRRGRQQLEENCEVCKKRGTEQRRRRNLRRHRRESGIGEGGSA